MHPFFHLRKVRNYRTCDHYNGYRPNHEQNSYKTNCELWHRICLDQDYVNTKSDRTDSNQR